MNGPSVDRPGVVFAMRYPDDVGVIWATMARVYEATAKVLGDSARCLVAYPRLTERPARPLASLRAIQSDWYDTGPTNCSRLAGLVAAERIRAVVYFGTDATTDPRPMHRLGVRTVDYDQNSYPEVHRQSHWKHAAKWVLRRLPGNRLHHLYLANAEHQRTFMIGFAAVPGNRIRVVPNGIDVERFCPGPSPDPTELGVAVPGPYVLSVCQARAEKRVDLLINAAVELRRRTRTKATFIHVGDGPSLDDWRRQADEAGLRDRFLFLGNRADPAPLYRLATVFAHFAERESFGFAVAEAMATGRPVVAARAAGPSELLAGGVGGILFDKGDVIAAASAMASLLSDPARAERVGCAGRDRITSTYTLDRQAMGIADAIREVLL